MNQSQSSAPIEGSPFVGLLNECKPIYILPRDDVAEAAISPAMAVSEEVSIMMGFFSSASLAEDVERDGAVTTSSWSTWLPSEGVRAERSPRDLSASSVPLSH